MCVCVYLYTHIYIYIHTYMCVCVYVCVCVCVCVCVYIYTIHSEKAMALHSQYSCLENPVDGGAWSAAVNKVTKSWTRLSDFTFTFHFHAVEKTMAPHSRTFAWRIPGTGEPDGLPSMGSHRVGHD